MVIYDHQSDGVNKDYILIREFEDYHEDYSHCYTTNKEYLAMNRDKIKPFLNRKKKSSHRIQHRKK